MVTVITRLTMTMVSSSSDALRLLAALCRQLPLRWRNFQPMKQLYVVTVTVADGAVRLGCFTAFGCCANSTTVLRGLTM